MSFRSKVCLLCHFGFFCSVGGGQTCSKASCQGRSPRHQNERTGAATERGNSSLPLDWCGKSANVYRKERTFQTSFLLTYPNILTTEVQKLSVHYGKIFTYVWNFRLFVWCFLELFAFFYGIKSVCFVNFLL